MSNRNRNPAGGLNRASSSDALTKYMNPRTDFAFKLLLGKDPNKDLMIDFLNGIFSGRKVIRDLQYNNPEQKGRTKDHRRTVFDLYCTDQNGGKFIVEMQQPRQEFFKDRIIFYSANMIQERGISVNADWDYELPEVYFIALMDFCFDNSHPDHYVHHVRLMDVNTNTQFYDKLEYIFVELPKFKKTEAELESKGDNWFFTINNLEKLNEIPLSLSKIKEFTKLFEIAQVGKLNQKDMDEYQQSLKVKRDNYSALKYATKTGLKQGLEQGLEEGQTKKALEIAAKLKLKGVSVSEIAELTDLSISEIEAIE